MIFTRQTTCLRCILLLTCPIRNQRHPRKLEHPRLVPPDNLVLIGIHPAFVHRQQVQVSMILDVGKSPNQAVHNGRVRTTHLNHPVFGPALKAPQIGHYPRWQRFRALLQEIEDGLAAVDGYAGAHSAVRGAAALVVHGPF